MSDIELVIKIPEDSYKATCNGWMLPSDVENVIQGIKKGTPLPKERGRLIDADSASKDINAFQDAFAIYTDNMGKYNIVCAAPTVIEADKAESEVRDERKTEK